MIDSEQLWQRVLPDAERRAKISESCTICDRRKYGAEAKVSVFCITYNHQAYIRKALEGFVMQKTNFPFEVLVHDDASADGTKRIIEEFAERYPDIIVPMYERENLYSQYEKTGIRIIWDVMYPHARGKYVAFCEGDDFWCDPDKLQSQYDALELHPECSAATCVVRCITDDGVDTNSFFSKDIGGIAHGIVDEKHQARALSMCHVPYHVCSILARREIFDDVVSRKAKYSFLMAGDAAMWRTILAHGSCFHFSRVMAKYRLGAKDGYSDKMSRAPTYVFARSQKRLIVGDQLFDEYTNYKFHSYVSDWIVFKLRNCFRFELMSQAISVRTNSISFCSLLRNMDGPLKVKMFNMIHAVLIKICSSLFSRSINKPV